MVKWKALIDREIVGLGWEMFATLVMLEVLNVRRDRVEGKVIHTFIKMGVLGNLDAVRFSVIPDDVGSSAREETEKDTLARVVVKFGRVTGRGLNPDRAAKSAESG